MANGSGFAKPPSSKPPLVTRSAIYVQLILLVVFIVAAGVAHLCIVFSDMLFGTAEHLVGWVPWLGGKAKAKLVKIAQRISAYMGKAANGADSHVGAYFHALASEVSAALDELFALTVLAGYLVVYVTKKYALPVIAPRVKRLELDTPKQKRQALQTRKQVKQLQRTVQHPGAGKIGGAIQAKIKPVSARQRTFEHTVSPQLKKVRFQIGRIILPRLEGLEHFEAMMKRQTHTIRQRVKKLELATAGKGGAVIVALGLTALGLNWIRCRNWRSLGKNVCRLPTHFLDDLLGLLADFVVLTNICTVLPWLEDGFSLVATPLIEALTPAFAGVCHGSDGAPDPLVVPQTYRPPNPGITGQLLP